MASKGLNKVQIIGNLGKDPESRFFPNGDAVVNFSIATSETWNDKQTGEKKEKTEWHRIVAFRKLAEIITQYVHKGDKLYIEGKLQTRKWQNKEGQDVYTTEIVADQMQMLGSKSGGQQQAPAQQAAPAQQQAPAQQAPADDGFDDDIPF